MDKNKAIAIIKEETSPYLSYENFNPIVMNAIAENIWLSIEEEKDLQEKTCQFWHLQLQFFNMDELSLIDLFTGIKHSSIYKKNKFTKKFEKMMHYTYQMSEKDMECLATHLALQLSGIEE